jgi:hypothetical protein
LALAQWHTAESGGSSDGRFAISGDWVQYRAVFLSPDGVNYPVLDKVAMHFE